MSPVFWIDTHCHLDYLGTAEDIQQEVERAQQLGVRSFIVPSVDAANFQKVQWLAHQYDSVYYTLGIHPLYVLQAQENDLIELARLLDWVKDDPKCVGVGEIGLDGMVPELQTETAKARQCYFFSAQLELAQRHNLPVILHTRKMLDTVLKYLRQKPGVRGVCHAFNGSLQQAKICYELGYKLGAGGAMTYPRALQIRRLVAELPLQAWVLETDAPDIPPEWLGHKGRNTPKELARIAEVFAEIRLTTTSAIHTQIRQNTMEIFSKMTERQF